MPDDAPPPLSPPPPAQPSFPPAPTSGPTESQARMWNMWCHLSALSGCIGVPFGNILGPLLVWQIKKDKVPSVAIHGKAALNFHITMSIAIMACFMAALVFWVFCIGVLFLIPLFGIGIYSMICSIIAGIKANEGKEYKYSFSFTFVN